MTTLDIALVNYHTLSDLVEAVESFERNWPQVPTRLHIVNVDERAEERGYANEVQKRLGYERVGILGTNWNSGYAVSCNIVSQNMKGDILAFCNADVAYTPGAVDLMVLALQKNPRWGIAGPRQVNPDGLIVAGGIFGTNEKPVMRGWNTRDRGEYNDVRDDCVSVSGSAIFFTRECWDELSACDVYQNHVADWYNDTEVAAFLPTQHYYEETWACYHARDHGFDLGYFGPALLIHKWHRASPIGGTTDALWMSESRERFRAACEAHGIAHD